MPLPFQRRLTVWASLCIVAALLLSAVCFVDTAMAGHSWKDSDPFPYATANSVHFGLDGFRFFYNGHLLTGPHIGYPLVLAALAVSTALLWLVRGWGERSRRMLRVSAVTLLLTLGLGFPALKLAEWKHNQVLAGADLLFVPVSPLILQTERCLNRSAAGHCTDTARLVFPNPTAWGLAGLFLTGLAGLRRESPTT